MHVTLLLEGDVSAEQLVLVGHLREKLLVEADLLDEADDGLLFLALDREPSQLKHLLLLFSLDESLQVALVHELV